MISTPSHCRDPQLYQFLPPENVLEDSPKRLKQRVSKKANVILSRVPNVSSWRFKLIKQTRRDETKHLLPLNRKILSPKRIRE